MAQPGCVGNYANQLAERSTNLDWQIRTAMDLVADRYADINNVSHHEAIWPTDSLNLKESIHLYLKTTYR